MRCRCNQILFLIRQELEWRDDEEQRRITLVMNEYENEKKNIAYIKKESDGLEEKFEEH